MISKTDKRLEDMRDCVKKFLFNGSESNDDFKKMRHAIIVELLRVGYKPMEVKDVMLEWNKKCANPVSLSNEKHQILKYVDWVVKKKAKTGCRSLEDYCLGQDACTYHKLTTYAKQKEAELPFTMQDLEKYLEKVHPEKAYVLMLVAKAIRRFQLENNVGRIIFVGMRTIESSIRDKDGHLVDTMEVNRRVNELIELGVVEKVVQGRPGTFKGGQSNGYAFLPWSPADKYP